MHYFDSLNDFLNYLWLETLLFVAVLAFNLWALRCATGRGEFSFARSWWIVAFGGIGFALGGLLEWWLIKGGRYRGHLAWTFGFGSMVIGFAFVRPRQLAAEHEERPQE